jgi:hypothetical protein
LSDKVYFALPAHILYLFFPNYGISAIPAIFIIDKLMQMIFGRKATRIKVVLMFIDSSHEIIRNPDIQGRPCIGHNIYRKDILLHSAIISERFRTSRNDIQTPGGITTVFSMDDPL